MNTPQVLKALHLFGAILWVGGIAFVGALGVQVGSQHQIEGRKLAYLTRFAMLARVTTGMVLTFIGGLAVFVPNFATYKTQGWMHAKLVFVLLIAGVTGALSAHLRKASEGTIDLLPTKVRVLSMVALALAAGVIVLAVLRPF